MPTLQKVCSAGGGGWKPTNGMLIESATKHYPCFTGYSRHQLGGSFNPPLNSNTMIPMLAKNEEIIANDEIRFYNISLTGYTKVQVSGSSQAPVELTIHEVNKNGNITQKLRFAYDSWNDERIKNQNPVNLGFIPDAGCTYSIFAKRSDGVLSLLQFL